MKLYLNELAPWERKNEYYNNIQLGKDIKNQSRLIKEQQKQLLTTQIENANRLIASQEIIAITNQQYFSNTSNALDDIACGIDELKASFEWGISEIAWQIEQNREVFKSIEKGIWSPYDARARNKKEQAQEAYNYGWIDESEEYFLESEQILKTDFSVHISLGMIYLFHKIDKGKALSYFEKAIKYARPKSNFYTSFALLHKALIHFDLNDLNSAINSAIEAIELSPNFSEAYYQLAQYYAQSKEAKKSIDNLYIAIKSDKNYCLKADNDSLLDPVRENVNSLFELIRNDEKQKALPKINSIKEMHQKSLLITNKYCEQNLLDSKIFLKGINDINMDYKYILKTFDKSTYFDLLDLNNNQIDKFEKRQKAFNNSLKNKIFDLVNSYEKEKVNSLNQHELRISNYFGVFGSCIMVGSFIVPTVATLFLADGWAKIFAIIFCIPYLSQLFSIVCIFLFFFNDEYSQKDSEVKYLVLSIFIFLIISVVIFLISIINSKQQAKIECKKQTGLINSIEWLYQEAKKL